MPDPSLAVAFTVMIPLSTAVTRPEEFIEACPVSFKTDNETDLSKALAGNTVTLS